MKHPKRNNAQFFDRLPNKLWLFLCFCIVVTPLLSSGAFASFTDGWGQYQDDPSNRGFVHDETGTWDLNLSTSTVADGSGFQPLMVDIDQDSDLDMIISSGNFIKIYDSSMVLIDELNLGTPVLSQMSMTDDWTNNTYPEINAFIANKIIVYEYNGTGFTNIKNHTLTNTGATYTGIQCSNSISGIVNRWCFYVVDNGTNDFIVKYNMTNETETSIGSMNVNHGSIPAVFDIDRDLRFEIIITCDDNANSAKGICVIDANLSNGGTPYLDTGFSSDGILDDQSDNSGRISNPVVLNIDGGGDSEIAVSIEDSANDEELIVWNSDGSQYMKKEIEPSPAPNIYVFQPVSCTINSTTILFGGYTWHTSCASNNCHKIYGYDSAGVLRYNWTLDTNILPGAYDNQDLICADMNGDGNDDVIWNFFIYDMFNSAVITNFTGVIEGTSHISLADMNDDGSLDIAASLAGTTKLLFSDFVNAPPTILGDYGQNLCGNICLGSAVTFTGAECGSSNCNYNNDVNDDRERLSSLCGSGTSTFNGSYSLASPTLSCTYSNLGSYATTIFLEDESNPGDTTQSRVVVVSVINGTSGVTCNLPCSSSDALPSNTTIPAVDSNNIADETAVQGLVNDITGTSTFVKSIFVIIFTMMLVFALASRANVSNPIVIAISVTVLWIMFAMIGLMNWLIVIFVMIALALWVALSWGSGNSGNGGG